MRAYGAKRTYGGCSTSLPKQGGKIKVKVFVKNPKRERSLERIKLSTVGVSRWRRN